MEIKESYLVLELEVGATREAVEAAYCRLLERHHPDRAASGGGGTEAVREAQRMVKAVNEAYQTLVKIAPSSGPASAPPPTAGTKPRLPVPPPGPPVAERPAPPPPQSQENWAAKSGPVSSAPTPPKPVTPQAVPMIPTPAATPPPAASTGNPPAPAFDFPAAKPASASLGGKATVYYTMLFPVGSPRRRFGPLIVAGALIVLIFIVTKCVSRSPEQIRAATAQHVAQTTGRLLVKSNLASTTVEATRLAAAGEAASSSIKGTNDGAAEQVLASLPPGKYAVTARSAGFQDSRQEVTVDVGQTTEVAFNFKGGSLRLDSDPAGATVKLGEAVLGKTPLVIPNLAPGECRLTLEYQSWPVVILKTTIAENTEATETVRLPYGKLTVGSVPSGATVNMDGRAVGKTPVTLERVPVGTRKLTLQGKDFPVVTATVRIDDHSDVKFNPALGTGFPLLDPAALLRDVWVPDNPDKLSPQFDTAGAYQPHNGIVKNLQRKRLYQSWLGKSFRFAGTIKSYDPGTGQIEFAEQKSELTRFRVLAKLSPAARNDNDPAALPAKDAAYTLYGRLSAVEEPKWPAKVITVEFSEAEPLR